MEDRTGSAQSRPEPTPPSGAVPKVVRYRWDSYGSQSKTTPWYSSLSKKGENGHFWRACRHLLLPTERVRFELDNGQQCIVRLRPSPPTR